MRFFSHLLLFGIFSLSFTTILVPSKLDKSPPATALQLDSVDLFFRFFLKTEGAYPYVFPQNT
ncbi:MAG: hypothetical protein A3D96_01635 [Chlamydiae bacterium RIFCSPHIGHO2_12_FULL_44_59]|nr:MAG: hypothetical protein A2796_01210 [Chlamydiae bacterium RIFCSPHIGHO2_01_FULL_44_39]OGN59030.1 MAG: hypothetical protein A3C42_03205 [Chlamydiae bacterium RIFCSPHIGHO2_02_FULL_45_9]OGN60560.1 MAG: hypothetical protein A3D96_01635 [Chlamydiae bacterium RIFCSPHIGHO2_12_FULL_44_59]OGN66014.1 MAG: hypothetical protein A2978_04925 [Chlamydiae bacterium RIFCSPLOWO2_01_FULL_44_52]OGN68830.1 MAG: hypothetical protein A3I67_00585 [Chlamydiae bacterium RIFCSPLOWO2_02_FULL_45_22]OGN70470.1 MAG: hyp